MASGYLSEIFVSFQGEGAHVGERHLFVRLAGCNIRCRYCDTPDSLERTPGYRVFGEDGSATFHSNPIGPAQLRSLLSRILERAGAVDAVAITGGEPVVQAQFLEAVLGQPDRLGVPILLETNGVLPDRLDRILNWIDIVSMDIKLPSNSGERSFWPEHAEFLARCREKDLYVKVLVDQSTDDAEVEQAFSMVHRQAPQAAAFLQPIVEPSGRSQIKMARIEKFYGLARAHHNHVRVLPQVHKILGIR